MSVKPATVRQLVSGADCIIKGGCKGNHLFKQLALGPKDLPTYVEGKTYLLFLPEPSEKTGLVAPLGIWQGRYELIPSDGGWSIPSLKKRNSVSRSLSLELSSLPQGRVDPAIVSSLDDYGRLRLAIQSILKESK